MMVLDVYPWIQISSNVPPESLNGSGQCVPLNIRLNVVGQQTLAPDVGGSKRKCSHGLRNLNEDDGQCLPLGRDVNISCRQMPVEDVEDVGGSKRRCVRQLHSVEMLQDVNAIPSDINVDAPDVQMSLASQQLATNNSLGVSDSVSHSCVPLSAPRGFTRGTFQVDNHTAFSTLPSNYKSVRRCEHSCEYYGALFWYEERLKSIGRNRRPKYGHCCKGRQVVLRMYQIYPDYIKLLLNDRHFMENIRAYNEMFSITSLGAHIDESVNNGRGPYVFKICGQLYHWLGSLCPAEGEPLMCCRCMVYLR
ncbi:hypothetical protein Tco_0122569 [Tanacetum coccineum]